jgi:hypothetical protein
MGSVCRHAGENENEKCKRNVFLIRPSLAGWSDLTEVAPGTKNCAGHPRCRSTFNVQQHENRFSLLAGARRGNSAAGQALSVQWDGLSYTRLHHRTLKLLKVQRRRHAGRAVAGAAASASQPSVVPVTTPFRARFRT